MRSVRAIVCGAALVLLGCQSLDCKPITSAITGDPSKDIVGTWGGFGTDSPVVFDFKADGQLRIVEAPNMYAPGGTVSDSSYTVDAAASTWTQKNGTPTPFTVTTDALIETPVGGTTNRSHSRVSCTGFGFAK
jgi:hypothetical protein